MTPPTPLVDPLIKEIADYVGTKLNAAYPTATMVRSVEYYDTYNVPISEFPLLKVSRSTDVFSLDTDMRQGQITLSYCLANVAMSQLPGINNFVSTSVVQALREFQITKQRVIELGSQISVRYRPMFQIGAGLIYQIDFSLSLKESG